MPGRSNERSQTKIRNGSCLRSLRICWKSFFHPHSSSRTKGVLGLASLLYLKLSKVKNKSGRSTKLGVRDKPSQPKNDVMQSKPRGRSMTDMGKSRKPHHLTVATWNIRTLMDDNDSRIKRPQRRSALIAHELKRYTIDIAALCELKRPGEGRLTEEAGYTFFWKGKENEETNHAGVGFAISNHLMKQFHIEPIGISDRLMYFHLQLNRNHRITFISAYAPTLPSSDQSKLEFYAALESILQKIPSSDKVILMGDFNARVGSNSQLWEGALGTHGIGKVNDNGLLLLELCVKHNLSISNTFFQQKDKYKTTWMHPRSKCWHMIDFVIVRQRDRRDIRLTRVMRGAECWTDHRLVRSKLSLLPSYTSRNRRKVQRNTRLNTASLSSIHIKQQIQDRLESALGPDTNSERRTIEEKWTQLKNVLLTVGKEVLGTRKIKRNKDWFNENDEEIMQLLDKKHQAFKLMLQSKSADTKRKYQTIRNKVQGALRKMKNDWFLQKAKCIQAHANAHNAKLLYESIRELYGPSICKPNRILDKDGETVLTEKQEVAERWREHFSDLLNSTEEVNHDNLNLHCKKS